MSNTNRREFMQLIGVTTVMSTLQACGLAGYRNDGEQPHRHDSRR